MQSVLATGRWIAASKGRTSLVTLVVLLFGCVLAYSLWAQDGGFRGYDLRSARASDVAPQLQKMLSDAAVRAEVLVDRRPNRILVKAAPAAQRLAAQIIETLDEPPSRANLPNSEEGVEVKGYRVAADKLDRTAEQLRRQYPSTKGVRVGIDRRTSQLVVVAPSDIHRQIAQRFAPPRTPAVQAAAQQPADPVLSPIRGYQLQNISWRDLEDALRRIWGQRLAFLSGRNGELATVNMAQPNGQQAVMQIDRRRDYILFAGPDILRRSWQQVVRAMDGAGGEEDDARVVPVRRADPVKIQQTISLIQAAARTAPGLATTAIAVPGSHLQADRTAETVATALQPNPAAQDPAPQNQPAPGQPNQPAADQPGAAEQPDAAGEQGGLIGDVRIEFIPELGIIIVRGHQRDVERVQRIIDEIIKQSEEVKPEIDLVLLKYVNSQTIAGLVVELYDEVFAPRQGPLSITSLDKPNALLLIGRQESMEVVKQLILRLDQPVPPSSQLRVFPLKYLSAVDAERLVRDFFTNLPGAQGQEGQIQEDDLRPGLGTRARVLADYRSNSLIVHAGPRDLAEVAYFIEQIDVPSTEASNELRVFRLQNALAEELAPVLQEAISGTTPATVGQPGTEVTRPSTKLSIIGVDAAGNKIIDSGILSDVSVTADPNVNALLVRAPADSMDLITELVRQLDQLPKAEAQIKVFQIENGDATSLTGMLQSLFGQQITAGQGNLGQTLNLAFGAVGQTAAAAGESSLVPLRFAVDVRTNSIIASGTVGDLNVVEILLLRLDEGDIETRKMTVYRLKNAPALDVANSITTFLQSQRDLILAQLTFNQAVSPFEQIEREVIVVPELVTNSLIVSATPRYYDQIIQVIEDLDFRPPMVMVQVVIAEVELDDQFEFGVELGLQDSLLFDRGVVVDGMVDPGFNFNNQPLGNSADPVSLATRGLLAGQALSSFSVGRSSASLGYGGLVLSAANESINVLVRALQDAGRLQILSRPQVMVLDNQPAFVQVGERVPRIVSGGTTPQGGTQNQTVDVDVGILLRIQPRINQENLIVMNIDAEISQVGEIEDGIPVSITEDGEVINSPRIDTKTAQTTISAYDGQTVVFAGLIAKARVIGSRRVPLLSDVPIFGRLFRFDVERESRRELLIIMTPHIVDEDGDYEWIKLTESERMSWCLADVLEMHGDVGLSGGHGLWGPPTMPMIFPDIDPTGTAPVMVPRGEESRLSPPEQSGLRELPQPAVRPAPEPVLPDDTMGAQMPPRHRAWPTVGPVGPGLSLLPPAGPPPASDVAPVDYQRPMGPTFRLPDPAQP